MSDQNVTTAMVNNDKKKEANVKPAWPLSLPL